MKKSDKFDNLKRSDLIGATNISVSPKILCTVSPDPILGIGVGGARL